ncbi:hypothetical protein [Streptomyces sp. ICBB 8177]|uniref:hypothetical protein n=1 Tax=Streptomyces sp. ICBB 8177 TaxID=563922 RepID=UPI000D672661|nr:hypothetical protein [Streptomyces sp. ICBB 8177]PWI40947.1 hypothetical protein CK485_26515 [Streptomyces sp. ICBB 8177]
MGINGGPGAALLVAASPVGRARLMDASAALPALAAVPPQVLCGSVPGAGVVELVDPVDPHVVLSHLRTAAATPGPLLVHFAGPLLFDSRQRLPHLGLARTTPATVRYSALPWHLLVAELRDRGRDRPTAVVVDLVADARAWPLLARQPDLLARDVELYGVVSPPPARKSVAQPLYSRALAEALRAVAERPPLDELHAYVVGQALTAGLDERALRFGGGSGRAATGAVPTGARVPSYGQVSTGADAPVVPDASCGVPEPRAAGAATPVPFSPAAPAAAIPAPVPASPTTAGQAQAMSPAPSLAPVAPPLPAGSGSRPRPVPSGATVRGAAPAALPARPPRPAVEAASPPDPHPVIWAAAHAGRHTEAAAVVAAWEQQAWRTYGAGSPEAIHWIEVRAVLARIAGDPGNACELWAAAANARLARGESGRHPEVLGAVDRAQAEWQEIRDPDRARALAATLVPLRRAAPGGRPEALAVLERQLASRSQGL